mgnify:FL=1
MPLRDLFGLLAKRQTSSDKYLYSSVNIASGRGQSGAARAPFSQQIGVSSFRSWVYAAATINANGVSSVPLRLYSIGEVNDGSATRSVDRVRKSYLNGRQNSKPSSGVIRKAAAMGDQMQEVEIGRAHV